jgi:heme/copper-type cytochrome/quinol oxidase subunit 2
MAIEGDVLNTNALRQTLLAAAALAMAFGPQSAPMQAPHVIEITADHDSRYKMAGQKEPVITVHAGEQVTLRITAIKAKNRNRDGSIHGFSLLRAKDRSRVPEWDFVLKPGVQEFMLNAPSEPGEYVVVCTVICSADHEGMHMRFVVVP